MQNIEFSVSKGESLAVLGMNGAGKSTLLKAVNGLIRPSSGEIETSGNTLLLSGTDPGFLPRLSGLKNLKRLGKAFGFRGTKLDELISNVIDFSDLGDAVNRSYGGYSTGMKGKLGFGFITALKPDVLLIDETLAVGDPPFRNKAMSRLSDMIEKSGTVIISTHSVGFANSNCERGIVLEEGKIIFDGEVETATALYSGRR